MRKFFSHVVFVFPDMNHAFQLAARAVFLSNSADIEKFSFELPYVKPNVSTNTTADDDSTTSMYIFNSSNMQRIMRNSSGTNFRNSFLQKFTTTIKINLFK